VYRQWRQFDIIALSRRQWTIITHSVAFVCVKLNKFGEHLEKVLAAFPDLLFSVCEAVIGRRRQVGEGAQSHSASRLVRRRLGIDNHFYLPFISDDFRSPLFSRHAARARDPDVVESINQSVLWRFGDRSIWVSICRATGLWRQGHRPVTWSGAGRTRRAASTH